MRCRRAEVLVYIAGVARRGPLVAGDLACAVFVEGGDDHLARLVADPDHFRAKAVRHRVIN
jgi:hypothetical protein